MLKSPTNRREFFRLIGRATPTAYFLPMILGNISKAPLARPTIFSAPFTISLSQRSLTHSINSGRLEHLEFARFARQELQIKAVDYASSFFRDHVGEKDFLTKMNKRAADEGVRHILLLIEEEGDLMAVNEALRKETVEKHRLWIDAAATLGCRGVRVQLIQNEKSSEHFNHAVQSIKALAGYAAERKIQLLIGNQRGAARDPEWLRTLVKKVDSKRLGTFPYFMSQPNGQTKKDPYEVVESLMPTAKGVCASSRQFDEQGRETSVDFYKLLKIVIDSGYAGYVSLEFQRPAEPETDNQTDAQPDMAESTVSKISSDQPPEQESQGQDRTDQNDPKKEKTDDGESTEIESAENPDKNPVIASDDQESKAASCEKELAGIKATLELLKSFKDSLTG